MWQAYFQWRGYEKGVLINTLLQEQEPTGLIPELFQLIHDYACILDWEPLYQVPVVSDAGFYVIISELIRTFLIPLIGTGPSRYAFHPTTEQVYTYCGPNNVWIDVSQHCLVLSDHMRINLQRFTRVMDEFIDMQRLYGVPNDRVRILVGQYPIPFHASGKRFGPFTNSRE
jgi:hypothetical protein